MLQALDLDLKVTTWLHILSCINMVRLHSHDYIDRMRVLVDLNKALSSDSSSCSDTTDASLDLESLIDTLADLNEEPIIQIDQVAYFYESLMLVDEFLSDCNEQKFIKGWLVSLSWSFVSMYRDFYEDDEGLIEDGLLTDD